MLVESTSTHMLGHEDNATSSCAKSTPMVEDYLKAIYLLQKHGTEVSITRLSAQLRLQASSVSMMIQRMKKRGLVEHVRYQGIRLTVVGEQAALSLNRTHRLIETLLVETFGYSWAEVHMEAEVLEHYISPRLTERIAAFLGHPTMDPHGDPIPQPDGSLPEQHTICLTDAPLDTPLRVQRVLYQDAARLCYLSELGISLGTVLEMCGRAPFDGPLQLRVAANTYVMDYLFAKHILVAIT